MRQWRGSFRFTKTGIGKKKKGPGGHQEKADKEKKRGRNTDKGLS